MTDFVGALPARNVTPHVAVNGTVSKPGRDLNETATGPTKRLQNPRGKPTKSSGKTRIPGKQHLLQQPASA